MKTYDEFKKAVYKALENSNIKPKEIIEQDTAIIVSIPNNTETPRYLKNLSAILEAQKLRFKSSISVPSLVNSIRISIFKH